MAHDQILFNNMSESQYHRIIMFIFIFIAGTIYFKLSKCKLDVLILHSFVLISSWGCWSFVETWWRAHVYGWYV